MLAASIVLRLQTIVSREIKPGEFAVVTVGSSVAGSKSNIVPDRGVLLVNLRTYDMGVREQVVVGIERIVRAECEAAGSPQPPTFEYYDQYPLTDNDPEARWSGRISLPMLLMDSLALALFAVVGVERTLAAGYPPASAVLIGVIAATAGGIIRDLLVGEAPSLMREGPWDALAALVGSVLMVVLIEGLGPSARVVEWPIILIIGALCALSAVLGWRAPMAESLAPVLGRPVAGVRRRSRQ